MSEQTSSTPRNPLAVTSLAMGVTGLVLSFFIIGGVLGLVALILGAIALARGPRKGMAVGGIVTGALAIPVALVVLAALLFIGPARARAREASAMTNLKSLALAATLYQAEWNQSAEHLGNLMPYLGNASRVMADPRLGRRPNANVPPMAPAAPGALDAQSDFYYAGAGLRSGVPKGYQAIILYDKGVPGGRRLVAFGDGHVESFKSGSPELHAAVERNNDVRLGLKLGPLPLDLDGPPPAFAPGAPGAPAAPEK